MLRAVGLVGLCALAACSGDAADDDPSCNASSGTEVGTLRDDKLVESSGLVASRKNPDVLWVHNDAGDKPRLFAVSTKGTALTRIDVAGAEARDWEDIA